jgi:hypothetical protein
LALALAAAVVMVAMVVWVMRARRRRPAAKPLPPGTPFALGQPHVRVVDREPDDVAGRRRPFDWEHEG